MKSDTNKLTNSWSLGSPLWSMEMNLNDPANPLQLAPLAGFLLIQLTFPLAPSAQNLKTLQTE